MKIRKERRNHITQYRVIDCDSEHNLFHYSLNFHGQLIQSSRSQFFFHIENVNSLIYQSNNYLPGIQIIYQYTEYFGKFKNGGKLRYILSYYIIYYVRLGHTVTSWLMDTFTFFVHFSWCHHTGAFPGRLLQYLPCPEYNLYSEKQTNKTEEKTLEAMLHQSHSKHLLYSPQNQTVSYGGADHTEHKLDLTNVVPLLADWKKPALSSESNIE